MHGRPSILETVLLSEDWNSTIYRIKYLDVLATHEKKIRSDITVNIDQLNDEKEKDQIQQSKLQKEKELGKEEAEAILNALKANESNMKKKIYKSIGRINLEKDW